MGADDNRTVYTRYFAYDLSTPAGTAHSSPQRTNITVEDTVLELCALTIPNGHVGLTGFAIDYAGERILPWSDPNAFVRGNDQYLELVVGINVVGRLTFVTFNEGAYDHGHIVRLRQRYRAMPDAPAQPALAIVV